MPSSFAFWKPSNADDQSRSPLILNDDAMVENPRRSDAAMSATQATTVFDLDPGTEDSGVFFFDEADFQPPTKPAVASAAAVVPLQSLPPPSFSLEEPQVSSRLALAVGGEKLAPKTRDRDSAVYLSEDEIPSSKGQTPASLASSDAPTCLRTPPPPSSIPPLKRTPSTHSSSSPLHRTDSHARRLRRPADLHLLTSKTAAVDDSSKPPAPAARSELEQRYDLIRNPKSNSTKATTNLRSPRELLRERLNLSPKKRKHEEKIRIFTPPPPMTKKQESNANGGGGSCLMPGPGPGGQTTEAFRSTSIRARTEAGDRPAWWCKFDKLVVFDGIDVTPNANANANGSGASQFRTRTSKGLSIARRRGDQETIVIPMDCTHCQVMLNRAEWKYDVRVCRRGVCWECRERCRWEVEQEREREEEREESTSGVVDVVAAATTTTRNQASRDRADSVLQDEQVLGGDEDSLLRKVGIEEQGRRRVNGTIEVVDGIEERLESLRMGN